VSVTCTDTVCAYGSAVVGLPLFTCFGTAAAYFVDGSITRERARRSKVIYKRHGSRDVS
jgi:hypothetical protein